MTSESKRGDRPVSREDGHYTKSDGEKQWVSTLGMTMAVWVHVDLRRRFGPVIGRREWKKLCKNSLENESAAESMPT